MLTLLKNQTVFVDDLEYHVISNHAGLEVLLENKQTGERTAHSTYDLLAKYLTGEFRTAAQRKHELRKGNRPSSSPARMDNLSVKGKRETHRRIDYLVRLQSVGAFSKDRASLRDHLVKIAAARGESAPPHESTIYRWRQRYERANNDIRALFARLDARGGKDQTRLHPDVEAMIDEVMDEIALKQRVCFGGELRDALLVKITAVNRSREPGDQLRVPSVRTMQRRLSALAAFDFAAARSSRVEAERRFALHGVARAVYRLLELVEIDHTPVDLMVVGEDRVAVGRPTITVVLDRASRCVLGYHLSMAGHGVPAVFAALQHALMPKLYLNERYADLELDWECFGWFERVLMDNGLEFHADAAVDALLNLGIVCEFAASRSPNDKPFVERFLRTFNYTFIHKLKGTTLSKAHQRVGFKPEQDAVLTLEELDRATHVWICNYYHKRPHRGLDGRAPIEVWRELAKAHPPQLKMNAADVEIEFSEVCTRRVQHYGIDLNTFVYRSPQLLALRRLMPENAEVTVKWPRGDVGHIWVWDTQGNEYLKVANTQPEYAGLTLEQAKAVRAAKAAGDPSYEQTQSEAGAILRGLVADADASTKLAHRRQGARLANRTSRTAREPLPPPAEDGDVPLPWPSGEGDFVDADEALDDIHVELPALVGEV